MEEKKHMQLEQSALREDIKCSNEIWADLKTISKEWGEEEEKRKQENKGGNLEEEEEGWVFTFTDVILWSWNG